LRSGYESNKLNLKVRIKTLGPVTRAKNIKAEMGE